MSRDRDEERSRRQMFEDHGKGEEFDKGWEKRIVDGIKNPSFTESPADLETNWKSLYHGNWTLDCDCECPELHRYTDEDLRIY